MTAQVVHKKIQQCDKDLRTLTAAAFPHMRQVKLEERSRWVHELRRQSKNGSKEATKILKTVKS